MNRDKRGMLVYRTVKCPYCGREQTVRIAGLHTGENMRLQHCEWEDGGCDKVFVVAAQVEVNVNILVVQPAATAA